MKWQVKYKREVYRLSRFSVTQKDTFILLMAFLGVFSPALGQVYIDAENASIRQSDGYINDNGRTLRWQANGSVSKPWVSGYKRAGSSGIGMRIGGASGSGNQRTEYCLNACYKTHERSIADGETWYTGFSLYLSEDEWANPTSWFVLYQAQQATAPGQKGNYPFVALDIESGNMLTLESRSGKNGNTARNPSPAVKRRTTVSIKKGVWYDIVVGWKFSPNSNNGWFACWVKTASQSQYVKYSMDNIKLGYYGVAQVVMQNKIGMYRGTVPGTNKLYYDEVRFAKNFNGARIPQSSGNNRSPYGGRAHTIPGTIEAEAFDNGGQGVAYNDVDPGNNGPNVARENEGVDIEARDGGQNVGWTANGEWLEYTVNASAGTYTIEARIATTSNGKSIVAKLDGKTLGTFNLPNTGNYGNFQTISIPNVSISSGNNKVLKLEFLGGGTNLNWVKFKPVTSTRVAQRPNTASLSDLPKQAKIQELQVAGVSIYPNPVSKGIFTVSFDEVGQSNISILDLQGKIVYQTQSDERTFQLELTSLVKPGIYLVKLKQNGVYYMKKVIFQ